MVKINQDGLKAARHELNSAIATLQFVGTTERIITAYLEAAAPSGLAPLEGVKALADRANAYDKPDHGEGPHDDREWVQVTLGELRALQSSAPDRGEG